MKQAHTIDGRRAGPRLPPRLAEALPLILLVLASATVIGLVEGRFLAPGNVNNLVRTGLIFATIAAGQMIVMISGGFDLSVGATAALSSVVSALAMTSFVAAGVGSEPVVVLVGVVAGLGVGVAMGLANGLAVALFHAPALIVTLGTMSVASGAAFYATAGTPIYGMPDLFARTFPSTQVLGLSAIALVCVVALLAVWVMQNLLAYGWHLRAVGSRRQAAHVAGISTRRTTVLAYVLSGACASLVGLLLTARLGSGQPTIGLDLMLPSIAVCVVGGVSLSGGAGRVERVVLAAAFLAIVANAMNLLRFDSRYQTIVTGLIIVAASFAEQVWRKRSAK